MTGAAEARRHQALEGRSAVLPLVDIVPAGPATRLSLRAPEDSRAALGKALGLALPARPKTSASAGARAALWLGPDEWLVIDTDESGLMSACAGVTAFHSAVDVSHRNVGIVVSGRGAEATLAAGCPQDLSPEVFPSARPRAPCWARSRWSSGERPGPNSGSSAGAPSRTTPSPSSRRPRATWSPEPHDALRQRRVCTNLTSSSACMGRAKA